MILPCIILTLIGLLGFLVPVHSGEKASIGVTTLLSMTVFLMIITENMPPDSENLPMIGKNIYLLVYNNICENNTSYCTHITGQEEKNIRHKAGGFWL